MDYDDIQRMIEAEAVKILDRVADAFESTWTLGAYPDQVANELRATARIWTM